MKTLFFFLATSLFGQAVFTPGVPAVSAKPAVLIANSPDGSIKCTLTGNTFPATAINFSCTLQGVTVQPFTIPISTFTAFTFQFNQGTNAVTVMLSLTPQSSGIATQAVVNGGTAVTGVF